MGYADMRLNLNNLLIGLALLVAAGGGFALKPTKYLAGQGPKVDLETMIPKAFGEWRIDETVAPIQTSPDVKQKLDSIYSELLARTYVNTLRQKVMLSIAYGSNQSNDEFQVHRPEYCYRAQGFELKTVVEDILNTPAGSIAVRRLEASQGMRNEPITYWITIGQKATLPGLGRKLAQLSYGLTGRVPDGMLVRVSSITNDRQAAYRVQDAFVNDLLKAVGPTGQIKILGKME